MGQNFYELVIEGPFPAVKGFILGLRAGSGTSGALFFSREAHIKTETLAKHFLEWTHLFETLCHVVVEENLRSLIETGVRDTFDTLKFKIRSVQLVKSAAFRFQFEVFAPMYADLIKATLANLPAELELSDDYAPKEHFDPVCKGVEKYAPCHDYRLEGKGSVKGPIDKVVSFYEKISKYDLIRKGPIVLCLSPTD